MRSCWVCCPNPLAPCARDPLFQAAARVRENLADCLVAGGTRATADVLRAALWLLGLAPGVKTLSSFFLMVTRDPERPTQFLPAYDSGDHLHPGNAGYDAMGKAIDLAIFRMVRR